MPRSVASCKGDAASYNNALLPSTDLNGKRLEQGLVGWGRSGGEASCHALMCPAILTFSSLHLVVKVTSQESST